MVIRPGLIGSLCRQPNWCEVEEVEEILMSKEVSGFNVSTGSVFCFMVELLLVLTRMMVSCFM